jgi:hypothetical protein
MGGAIPGVPASPGAGVLGTPPSTGCPERPGAGVPLAPKAGKVPCDTVEVCTGCSCAGAPMVLRLAVLDADGEHAANASASVANPAIDTDPRIQAAIDSLLP